MANNSFTFDALDEPAEQNCDYGVQYEVCLYSSSILWPVHSWDLASHIA